MADIKKLRSNLDTIVDEKTAFENEKSLLQRSAVLAEQRASGLQELWRSCKADLAAARLSAAQANASLTAEKSRVRQAKDENTELLEKFSEKEEQINKLLEDVHSLNEQISQLRKDTLTKDDTIKAVEKDNASLLIEMQRKDEELRKKDIELHCEMLKTEELHEKVEQLAAQIQKLQEKLDKWPFNFLTSWAISSHIKFMCYNISKNLYNKMINVTSIFKLN